MHESDEQLEGMLSNFEEEMRQRSKLLRDLQKSVDALNGEIGALRSESDQLNTQRGLAVSSAEQVDQCKKTLSDKMQQAARKHKVAVGAAAPEAVTVTLVRDFMQNLHKKVAYNISHDALSR
jgi:peptidoglycan hydrolase CwlO-like protein